MVIGGAAEPLRILRLHVVEQIRRPYVTAAKARGVPPFRIATRYVLRIALLPFAATFGKLFPALISGGVIVAMVLSLPTLGPLLFEALLSEDTYLAGSLIMILSVLAAFGTLISDLLILLMDPRARES